MKHATPRALKQLAPLLDQLRRDLADVTERKPGTFYRRSQALLHFHEDPAGLFADLKIAGAWQRFPVNHPAETATFIAAWRRLLASLAKAGQ